MPAADEVHLVAGQTDGGRRLDEFLASALSIGRRAALRLVERARVNGRRAAKGQRLRPGDGVQVQHAGLAAAAPPDAPLIILRSTAQVLVLAKPAALPSVGLRGGNGDSLAARIAARFPECAEVGQPGEAGLVHRLDTGTSGLLLAARTAAAYDDLRAQFRDHTVRKEYLALVAGVIGEPVRIDTPIGQHRNTRRRMRAVAADLPPRRYAPRAACTDVVPERGFAAVTLIRAGTTTGLRHQIRVHLASIGHPLLHDPLYGDPDSLSVVGLDGFLLHASRIDWRAPLSDEPMCDQLAPPDAWQQVLRQLAPGVS